MKSLLPCACLLFFALRLCPQTAPVEHIGAGQGLSQGFVTCLLQDREGFIWAGTPNSGLNRYDGHRFKHYTCDPFDPNSLSGNNIHQLVDLGDYLFVGTLWNGANLFHKKTGRFFRLPFAKIPPEASGLAAAEVTLDSLPAPGAGFIVMENDRTLWVTARRHPFAGVWLCRITTPVPIAIGIWERLPESSPAGQAKLLSQLKFDCRYLASAEIGMSEDGKTMFLSDGKQLFSRQQGEWEPLPLPPGLVPKLGYKIPGSTEPGVEYWQNTDGEIWRTEGAAYTSWRKVGSVPPGGEVLHLWKDRAKLRLGAYFHLLPLQNLPFRLDWEHPVWSVKSPDIRPTNLLDSSGNFWTVNSVDGLIKFSPQVANFHHIVTENARFYKPFLTTPEGVLSYATLNGALATLNGNVDIIGEPQEKAAFIRSACSAAKGPVYFIQSDEKNRVWMGGLDFMTRLDLTAGTTKTFLLPYSTNLSPKRFLTDEKGVLLLPLEYALMRLDPEADTAMVLDFKDLGLDGLQMFAIARTADGSVWLGTEDGLLRIFPGRGAPAGTKLMQVSGLPTPRIVPVFKAKARFYQTDPNDRDSPGSNFIVSLLTDPSDPKLLWIGTKGGGLDRLDVTTGKFTHLTIANGLPDNVIYSILPENASSGATMNFWLSTNKGLVKYNPATGSIKSYRKADGLQDDEFNTLAYAKDGNGRLYFGGINGMNVFDPAEITDNPHKPRVFITGLKINNQPLEVGVSFGDDKDGILTEAVEFCPKITLSYAQNDVTLEFAALEFTAPSKNRYRYWLEGLEKENAHESNEPQATYLSLPPGSYTFIVYGSNNDGVWSEQPARLNIRVLPPWYRHWLAYLSYALLLFGLLYWYWRMREGRRQLEHQMELDAQRLETARRDALHVEEINRLKLEEFTRHLLEKSEIIAALQAQLEDEHGKAQENGPPSPDKIRLLEEIRSTQILTQTDWENFMFLFDQVHPAISGDLSKRFPQLTAAETRIVLLSKLGIKNIQAATMLGVSAEAIKKARQRLRKKIGEDEEAIRELLGE